MGPKSEFRFRRSRCWDSSIGPTPDVRIRILARRGRDRRSRFTTVPSPARYAVARYAPSVALSLARNSAHLMHSPLRRGPAVQVPIAPIRGTCRARYPHVVAVDLASMSYVVLVDRTPLPAAEYLRRFPGRRTEVLATLLDWLDAHDDEG